MCVCVCVCVCVCLCLRGGRRVGNADLYATHVIIVLVIAIIRMIVPHKDAGSKG